MDTHIFMVFLLAGHPLPAVQFLGVPADDSVHTLPQPDLGGYAGLCHRCKARVCAPDITSVECRGWVRWRVLCTAEAYACLVSAARVCETVNRT